MKKIITLLMTAAVVFTGCKYDDDDLWNAVDDLDNRLKAIEQIVSQYNTDITSLQTLVGAINGYDHITDVKAKADGSGWIISFRNKEDIEILHGSAGADAPVIGVELDEEDGLYYWTLDGEPILQNGEKMPVTGIQGESGADAVAPVIGIDEEGYWTVDTGDGNGPRRIQHGNNDVLAVTEGIYSVFTDVIEYPTYYVFVMADGKEIRVPKAGVGIFEIDAFDEEVFYYGQSKTFKLTLENIANYGVGATPNGWSSYLNRADSTVIITAPQFGTGQTLGEIGLQAQGTDGINIYIYQPVRVDSYELRILSFEDKHYKGSSVRDYWTSLIDKPQYGGPLLYGDYSHVDYQWTDTGNTNLSGGIVESWGSRVFWNGGEAISNYTGGNIADGNYPTQLEIPYPSGRNGSKNFAVHFGYSDTSGLSGTVLSNIAFADSTARTVDHMWVTSTCYFLHATMSGDGFAKPMTANGYVDLVAIGYGLGGVEKGRKTYRIASGLNNSGAVTDWKKWDLSGLGDVVKIEFNLEGPESEWGDYGFAYPAYFAYDDVAVRFDAPNP